jgi:Cu(I)/Ag(I) efflux system membrane fusion protein
MRKQTVSTAIMAFAVFVLGILSNSVLADQKSEEKLSKLKGMEQVTASDEMSEILEHYFAIRELLAHDETDWVAQQTKEMTARLDRLIKALQALRTASDGLKADDLKQAREGFGPLSEAVLSYVKDFGFSGEAYSFHCSMMDRGWLQEHDQIGNPYYGSEMFKCGEMTGMVARGRFMAKAEGESEHPMHMKEMEGK